MPRDTCVTWQTRRVRFSLVSLCARAENKRVRRTSSLAPAAFFFSYPSTATTRTRTLTQSPTSTPAMAKRKLPDRPPNGIGAGQRPSLRPRALDSEAALATLTRPFKVPLKPLPTNARPVRSTRNKAVTYTYAPIQLPGDPENPDLALDSAGASADADITAARSHTKRIDALSARRLSRDPHRLQKIRDQLQRSFTVPIPGYVPRHNIPLSLGTKPKIVLGPRPLHDPTDEFAIVLYDPSVDGKTPELQDYQPNQSPPPSQLPPSSSKPTRPSATQTQQTGADSSQAGTPPPLRTHPKKLSNGLPNKTLRELLGERKLEKQFSSVPVVIDPLLVKILRPHQVEGVKFLYRCVTGLVMKDYLDQQSLLITADAATTKEPTPPPHTQSSSTESPASSPASTPSSATPPPAAQAPALQQCTVATEVSEIAQNRGAYGCIMADEMGLGKTLQCIALMWTLLRQGPQGKPTIDKCIIVCPSSLVNNWANEIVKWLGRGTLASLPIDGKKSSLSNGTVAQAVRSWALAQGRSVVKPVLIISYETLRRNVEHLRHCDVGLLLADEGHRLKNADSQTFTSLNSIRCPRRVILSGTPIQNDLSEYFALLNFSNPGLLGSRLEFRKNFELPILRGRDADAMDEDVKKGDERLQALSTIVSKFIIRRTNDILSKYLPCKYEHVIFVNLKPFQRSLYEHMLKSRDIKLLVKDAKHTQPLKHIGVLKKLCNHPDLLRLPDDIEGSEDLMPEDYQSSTVSKRGRSELQTWHSGKFSILGRFLHKIKTESDDKIVIISNYTQTLDLIEKMCRSSTYPVVRLDGTMTINKRQKLVDRFNDPEGQEFIFLLSSKAGGCGINLIGANRLILMDPDWNPAADQQALARVWRDGQKKDCFIYRFICTGSIEEKIYQRQSMKMSLSSCVVDEKEDVERLFSAGNLKQLFELRPDTNCDTHETYHCKRCKNGKQMVKSNAMLYGDATTWNHLNHDALAKTNDHLLCNEFSFDDISYVFQYISH
ncbi:DNA-dependent ATPase RAD54 [Lachancea thermotolerans CBS 6340]|uniref:DNA helicase n=1 Tax=Lachancea thermotolerans (strain ATCC 56472 / CBS 6340 / NRRL Y-8284) TaxID=559295 RepID=C5DNH3_LACTC|nr:KLTH0G17028p [Lachancea thermotolerans CBS 6340]CAR25334.1 KLTH0G17028p [Lachancea thermotolerans CBS 6340]